LVAIRCRAREEIGYVAESVAPPDIGVALDIVVRRFGTVPLDPPLPIPVHVRARFDPREHFALCVLADVSESTSQKIGVFVTEAVIVEQVSISDALCGKFGAVSRVGENVERYPPMRCRPLFQFVDSCIDLGGSSRHVPGGGISETRTFLTPELRFCEWSSIAGRQM